MKTKIPHIDLLANIRTESSELNDRERSILRSVVHSYILMANPVGSRFLSKYLGDRLSPATIRNVMSDLEEMGFITHPHTSAGRIPTDKGYRYYVDSLMQAELLTEGEERSIEENLAAISRENLLRDTSKILGSISHYLAIVELPRILKVLVRNIELFALSSTRLLVVVNLTSDVVRAITLETDFEVQHNRLPELARQINERISGKELSFVLKHFPDVIRDMNERHPALFRLFVESTEQLFAEQNMQADRIHIAGAKNLFDYPEFGTPEQFRSIIELVEDEEIVMHLLDNAPTEEGKVRVNIGTELNNAKMDEYSLLSTKYRFTEGMGTIGIIGPKRMNYAKMVSILSRVAVALSQKK